MDSGLYFRARRQRNRVAISTHLHATQAIDHGEADLSQVERISSQRQQVRLFVLHRCTNCLRAPAQDALPVIVRAVLQIRVQLTQIVVLRYRDPVVATEISTFALDASLFVAASWVAKLALKAPVRTEGDEAAGLFPPMATQDLLHRTRQVIVAEKPENPAKVAERQLVGFKKCLLCGVRVGSVKRSAAGHRTHLEDLQLGAFTVKIGVCLVPIHLRFHAPVVALRNKNLVPAQPPQPLLMVNVAAHRALTSREAGQLRAQSMPDPASGVTLLYRSLPIFSQNPVDEGRRIHQLP